MSPILPSPACFGQAVDSTNDVAEDDPWFSQDHATTAEEDEKIDSRIDTHGAPKVSYKRLMREYEDVPEYSLSQKLSLLRQAQTMAQGAASDEIAALIADRQARLDEIRTAIASAEKTEDLADAFELLRPHANYLSLDLPLRLEFAESAIVGRIEREIQRLSSDGDFEGLARIKSDIVANELQSSLMPAYSESLDNALGALVLAEWKRAVPPDQRLCGELQLLSKALGKSEPLPLKVVFRNEMDRSVSDQVTRSISRVWGETFLVSNSGREIGEGLTLEVDFGRFYVSKNENDTKKSSIIAGHVKEEPNPEFMELAAKYEKQAEQYEASMAQYEHAYKDYIESFGTHTSENASLGQRADALEASLQNRPRTGPDAPTFGEVHSVNLEVAALRRTIRENTIPSRIEPLKPHPYHLKTLDILYQTPSTIVTTEGQQNYEYIERDIEITFHGSADLKILDPLATSQPAQDKLELARQNSWTQNINVHPKDPAVGFGDYSPESVQSSQDLFALEFADQCAKRLQELADRTAESLKANGLVNSSLEHLVLAISLQEEAEGLKLDQVQILALAKQITSGELGATEIREECLRTILSQSSLAKALPQEAIQQFSL